MITGSIDTYIDSVIKKMCKRSFVKRNKYRSKIVTFDFAENGCAESCRSPPDAAAAAYTADFSRRTHRRLAAHRNCSLLVLDCNHQAIISDSNSYRRCVVRNYDSSWRHHDLRSRYYFYSLQSNNVSQSCFLKCVCGCLGAICLFIQLYSCILVAS